MNIWIDLANSPHVPFFAPIIKQLLSDNHKLVLTFRKFGDTVGLARRYAIQGTTIGKHAGRSRTKKVLNLVERSMRLWKHIKNEGIDIALSHNSYTQIVAGKLARTRIVTLMDYEGQPANHLAFRAAHKIIVPDSFPEIDLKKFGASFYKIYKYRGFKEQLYLSDFTPNESFYSELIDTCSMDMNHDITKTILVTVRTPPLMAVYHRFQNPLFETLLSKLNFMTELTVVALPRTEEQRNEIEIKFPRIYMPKYPLDGRNLVYYSDLVISAGGTMNREAAILGTPAYTIFAGRTPAVDRSLVEMGRMIELSEESDLSKIIFTKNNSKGILKNPQLCNEITREILT